MAAVYNPYQGHVIKIVALVTSITFGSYLLWHRFIKGRTILEEQPQIRQHPVSNLRYILHVLRFERTNILFTAVA